jgi:acyl dehydratase
MKEWYFEDIPLNQPMMTRAYVVTEAELVSFAKRWDPLPIHVDPDAAKASPHGGLIAPAIYTMAVANALADELDPRFVAIGSADWKVQFAVPVRPDDRLVAASECVYKRESRTKPDRGITRFVETVHNQKGERVLTWESTILVARR